MSSATGADLPSSSVHPPGDGRGTPGPDARLDAAGAVLVSAAAFGIVWGLVRAEDGHPPRCRPVAGRIGDGRGLRPVLVTGMGLQELGGAFGVAVATAAFVDAGGHGSAAEVVAGSRAGLTTAAAVLAMLGAVAALALRRPVRAATTGADECRAPPPSKVS